jgi:GNAT superfamily N-acetyltransferase
MMENPRSTESTESRTVETEPAVKPRTWVAGASDLAAVSDLVGEFRDWLRSSDPSDESLRETVAVLLNDPATEFLLGAPAGAPAGAVAQLRYRLSVWTGAEDCWLEDLFVREHDRRHGLGRVLVETAMKRARARGCRRIELDVQEDNHTALAFYASLGFLTEPRGPARTLLLGTRLIAPAD